MRNIRFLIVAVLLQFFTSCCWWWHTVPSPNQYQLYVPNKKVDTSVLKTSGAYAFQRICDLNDSDNWSYFKFFDDGRVFTTGTFSRCHLDTIDINTFHLQNKGMWGYYDLKDMSIEIELNLHAIDIHSSFVYFSGVIRGDSIILSDTQYYRKLRSKRRIRDKVKGCYETPLRHIDCCLGRQ